MPSFGCGLVVPEASHRKIALAARPGRIPVAEHWVTSSLSRNSYANDFVSQPSSKPDVLVSQHPAFTFTWFLTSWALGAASAHPISLFAHYQVQLAHFPPNRNGFTSVAIAYPPVGPFLAAQSVTTAPWVILGLRYHAG
jgi:hypothetical protein